MAVINSFALFFALVVAISTAQRLAGECAMLCNDLRTEVLTLEMCREAKRTLPKPKVGDFCSVAMEQGFSDVCVPLCMNQKPTVRVAQACRAAAVEMPRPTVRRWCEHGYTKAYEKTSKDLKEHFRNYEAPEGQAPFKDVATAKVDPHFRAPKPVYEEQPERIQDVTANFHSKFEKVSEKIEEKMSQSHAEGGDGDAEAASSVRPVLATIPITIDDVTKDLHVMHGQNAEEAVVMFCRDNVPADVSSCIRQLLTVVLEKMEEVAAADGAPADAEVAAADAEASAAAADAEAEGLRGEE